MTELHATHIHKQQPADGHNHDHPHHAYSARRHPEFVVLDIGAEKGALILHTDADMHGVEVEISRSEDDRRRSHKEVLERCINGAPAFTAVFDDLTAGAYTLWTEGKPRLRGVTIEGGEIAQLDWRTSAEGTGKEQLAATEAGQWPDRGANP